MSNSRDYQRRNGRVMPLEDAAGNTYQSAFVALSYLNVDVENGVIHVGIKAWKDVEAYHQGKESLRLMPGEDVKRYELNGPRFHDAAGLEFNGDSASHIITELVWQMVAAIKDVMVEPPSSTHPDGVYESFFVGAVVPPSSLV